MAEGDDFHKSTLALHPKPPSNHQSHQIFLFALAHIPHLSGALGTIMPLRFRKIISLGKGFRLNISKGGISSSIGGPGASLNIGKKGVRSTVGIPGTGLSYYSSSNSSGASKNDQTNALLTLIPWTIAFTALCCICALCVGVSYFPSGASTTSPTATDEALSIDQIIALTYSASQRLTQAAQSPTPLPPPVATSTLAPAAIPVEATSTIFIFELQTNVAQPTAYIFETSTPFVLASPQPASNGGGSFDTNGDGKVTCKDFQTQAAAQRAYNAGITSLDGNDGDGKACESLP